MPKRKILIVGGGTAGWITACRMAQFISDQDGMGAEITLIESPQIGIIGVGEGSFPTIKTALKAIGIDEERFMKACSATYKQGIKFVDWVHTPQDDQHSYYLHPFENPHGPYGSVLVYYWLQQDEAHRKPYAQTVTFQDEVVNARLGPKGLKDKSYNGVLQYAYHLDAVKFSELLAQRGHELGVKHLKGNVTSVHLDDQGAISSIITLEHGELTADLYIDCTGQQAELIGKALKQPFKPISDILFTDRAVVCQLAYDSPQSDIESTTISTAHEAGWSWDIGLDTRRGIGYVYSSGHISDDKAEQTLRQYVGAKGEAVSTRKIHFNAGYRQTQWHKNCVAIGLSAGFFEPLESTGIVLIEIAAGMLAEMLSFDGPIDAPAKRFNYLMKTRCEKLCNFIKLHYCLSKRTEPFWRDNVQASSIPDELQYMLEAWKYRPPSRFDFTADFESFSIFSYQYILYGMGYKTDFSAASAGFSDIAGSNKIFEAVSGLGREALQRMPTHRALIDSLNMRGSR